MALVTEFTPRARRITAVGIIFAGYSIGGIVAGLSATYVIGALGWQAMFFIGGALSQVTSAAFLLLPESLSFLAAQPARQPQATRVAAFLRPDLMLGPQIRVVAEQTAQVSQGRVADLLPGLWGSPRQ